MMTRKHLTKLIAALMLLAVSLTLAVMGTFAWLVLSTAPEIGGMTISIGGADTVAIAPDLVTVSADGAEVHYPGSFSSALSPSESGYEQLESVSGLLPVSTADGLHWYIPTYDSLSDGGQLGDIADFLEDTSLEYANRTDAAAGNYIYLDFWVVAPTRQTLRVSTSPKAGDTSGSFVLTKGKIKSDGSGGYTVDTAATPTEACVRIGFLVNEETLGAAETDAYRLSEDYNDAYTALRGAYRSPASRTYRFTIYEPNADVHPDGSVTGYTVTNPIGAVGGSRQPVDVSDILTVQRGSVWTAAGENGETKLSQLLQAALIQAQANGVDLKDEAAVSDYFYGTYLQNQLIGCVTTGRFISSTAKLHEQAATTGTVGEEALDALSSTATQDVYIVKLEPDVPQRIRMFIWLEGQDSDCVSTAAGGELAINLELAGESG